MKIKIIFTDDSKMNLTQNRIYEVIENWETAYLIKNDKGNCDTYLKEHFRVIKEEEGEKKTRVRCIESVADCKKSHIYKATKNSDYSYPCYTIDGRRYHADYFEEVKELGEEERAVITGNRSGKTNTLLEVLTNATDEDSQKLREKNEKLMIEIKETKEKYAHFRYLSKGYNNLEEDLGKVRQAIGNIKFNEIVDRD